MASRVRASCSVSRLLFAFAGAYCMPAGCAFEGLELRRDQQRTAPRAFPITSPNLASAPFALVATNAVWTTAALAAWLTALAGLGLPGRRLASPQIGLCSGHLRSMRPWPAEQSQVTVAPVHSLRNTPLSPATSTHAAPPTGSPTSYARQHSSVFFGFVCCSRVVSCSNHHLELRVGNLKRRRRRASERFGFVPPHPTLSRAVASGHRRYSRTRSSLGMRTVLLKWCSFC